MSSWIKAIIAKHASDIILARPDESTRDIIQTMLQITTVGDGAVTAWEKLTSTFVELSERELECGEDVVKLISNHFATIRHEDDIYRLVNVFLG